MPQQPVKSIDSISPKYPDQARPGTRQAALQKFIRLYLFVAIPGIFWIGLAGLLGALRLEQTAEDSYVFMSPGVASLLVCAAGCLQMARSRSKPSVWWSCLSVAALLAAGLTDRMVTNWHGERDAFLYVALEMGGLAALLVFLFKPSQGSDLTPRYSNASFILTLVGTFASVMGSYLMVERDLMQGQHYVQARADFVGNTLKISFDQPIGSIQRMVDRWKSVDHRPADAFISREFESHIRDMPSTIHFSLLEQDGAISTVLPPDASIDDFESLLRSDVAFRAFLDSVHKSGQARMSTPGLVPGKPWIAFVAASLGDPTQDWAGAVVATVDLTVLVKDAFTNDPPCCFVARGNGVEFFRSPDTDDSHPVAIARETFQFARMFGLEITFWKEMLPGEVGMSSYPVWVLVVGLLFTFFSNASQRLAQLALHRARLLQERALQDPLTGLPNRRKLRRLLLDAFKPAGAATSRESGRNNVFSDELPPLRASLMFIDMRGLRLINDSLGHEIGDRLIVKLAKRLTEHLESSSRQMRMSAPAVLARVDAGEFVVFLQQASDEMLSSLADSVLDILAQPVVVHGRELSISASIGISSAKGNLTDPMQLAREADLALLAAKKRGLQAWAQYDQAMGDQAALRMELSQRLKSALAAGEVFMVYQPLIDARSGQIAGMEALVRWSHPDYGFISPGLFIPMAEESGQIVELTNWTLRQACSASPAMRLQTSAAIIPIAVNISPVYFQREDFIEQIRELLAETGVGPAQLQLEITEGVLLRDQHEAVSKLFELRQMGIVTSLDDFGTGYSSLSYLKNLPIHKVKLDRSFVVDVVANKTDAELVRGVIEIVHNMGMMVVVEGVETTEQAELLRRLGSDQFQGFLFAKPLRAAEIQQMIVDGPGFDRLVVVD